MHLKVLATPFRNTKLLPHCFLETLFHLEMVKKISHHCPGIRETLECKIKKLKVEGVAPSSCLTTGAPEQVHVSQRSNGL